MAEPDRFLDEVQAAMLAPLAPPCVYCGSPENRTGCWCAVYAAVAASGETHGVLYVPEVMSGG